MRSLKTLLGDMPGAKTLLTFVPVASSLCERGGTPLSHLLAVIGGLTSATSGPTSSILWAPLKSATNEANLCPLTRLTTASNLP